MRTMKKVMMMMALMLMAASGYAQEKILGKWFTESGDAQVEIYKSGDCSFSSGLCLSFVSGPFSSQMILPFSLSPDL